MSDRPTDGGEALASETQIAESGRCRIRQACRLTCVQPETNALIGVDFEAGEEHAFDRLGWKCKGGSLGTGYVVRTGDGDAYLMPHLFERYCEVVTAVSQAPPREVRTANPVRPVRVINVKGMNKPDQRSQVVYVGRKFAGWPEHELHNPYKPVAGEPVGTCLAKYKAKLLARLTLEEDLAALWEETGQGRKALGCWCTNAIIVEPVANPVCHAQILGEMLRERFGGK